MSDLLSEIQDANARGETFAQGKAVFEAAQCAACHRFAGEGGATA